MTKTNTMKTKTCSKCGIEKPLSEFSPHPTCKDGVRGTCKRCASEFAKRWQREKRKTLRGYLDTALSSARHRARTGSIPFDLDLDYLVELWETQNAKCMVSGLPFQRSRSKWRRNPFTPSLDRIDPILGYTKGNVRFVLDAVNVSLNEWGLETMLPIFKAIVDEQQGD